MNKISKIMFVAFAALILTMLPDVAAAAGTGTQAAGGELLVTVSNLVKGSLGTLIGLGIALFGLYMWLIQQASWGIMVMIGGVALTAFPGIFDWMSKGVTDVNSANTTTGTIAANQ